MSADVLRRAASLMRRDSLNGQTDDAALLEAVAALLEAVAERQKPAERYGRRSHGWTASREANAVARAYLGVSA